ncbi:MAG: flavodoxin [Clostridium sp.]|nr:flavodoxin [Clostridium sp.]
MMKRAFTVLMSILLAFSLAGCSNQADGSSSQVAEVTESATSENEQEESRQSGEAATENQEAGQETDGENGKILVVYYSASGNTEAVARYIAAAANADTFELVPVEPYSEEDLDWTEKGSRVNREHDDESLRNIELVETTVKDWDSYQTVFIGWPIWWGIAAWPVDSFIEENDFSGKTVIPFCTSTSSGLGESGERLAEAAGTGNWLEGQRFSSGALEEDVQAWVGSLGLQ